MRPVGPSGQTRAQIDAGLEAIKAHDRASTEVKNDATRCRCGQTFPTVERWEDHQYLMALGAVELAK